MKLRRIAVPSIFMVTTSSLLWLLGPVRRDTLFHRNVGNYQYTRLNLLKPAGYLIHQQFNIQQLYVLPTLYLCVLYLSENKQRLVPLTA